MTTIITRFFESAAQARAVRSELISFRRFSPRIIDLYESGDGLVDALTAQSVETKTAEAYAAHMGHGGAVLLVRAGYKPLSVANITRDVMDEMGAADMGDLNEDVYVKDDFRPSLSVMQDHPLVMSRPRDPDSTHYPMADWPIPLISRRKPFSEMIFPPHARMADFLLPLTYRSRPFTGSIFGRHARMANFPIGLISRRKPYTGSIFGRHARMANFPIGLISRREPKNRSIFPRHQRMANFPFPLLINGKTGKNALIPGGPRMADFPIDLISKREPFTGSVIGRHSRMASFPIGLISRRKPSTASVIEPHARMANFPIPLTIDRKEFSFSKMLGLPTIASR